MFEKWIARRLAAAESEMLAKYYAEVEEMFSKMRGWRHDYRHHIQTMKAHARAGEYAEIDAYLDMLDADLTEVETVIRTGNRMADAILNSKLSIAAKHNIRIKAEARIPVALSIPEIDLCIILGNLLDNATEACAALPEEDRLIRLYMEMKGTYLYISVTNTARRREKDGLSKPARRRTRRWACPDRCRCQKARRLSFPGQRGGCLLHRGAAAPIRIGKTCDLHQIFDI